MKLLRYNTFERRLFGWLLVLSLVPVVAVLLAGAWLWSGALGWVGTLGAWDQLAGSARTLFEAAEPLAAQNPELAEAVVRHRDDLSASVTLARRWAYLGERLSSQLPLLVVGVSALLGVVALVVSRRLARELAQPIRELVDWTERLGREEALPEVSEAEGDGTLEVQALRRSLRQASSDLGLARRKALEMERVRVWGEMARRVAHEMKNPLTPMRLAAHRLASGGAASESLAVIREETARLEELAAQFAALGRPVAGPTSDVELKELLEMLVASDVPDGIVVSLSVEPDLPPVHGHYDALLRAFRNIVRNAVEALEATPPPRQLSVVVCRGDSPAGSGGGPPGGGQWLEVRVLDSGPGIPAELGDLIFEPDCTTKSRGTGLGLALVRQAVAAHGGEVRARNSPAGGAEFTIRLPAASEARVPQPAGWFSGGG